MFTSPSQQSHKQKKKKIIFSDKCFRGCYFKRRQLYDKLVFSKTSPKSSSENACYFTNTFVIVKNVFVKLFLSLTMTKLSENTSSSLFKKNKETGNMKASQRIETKLNFQKPLNYNFPSSKKQLQLKLIFSYRMIHFVIPRLNSIRSRTNNFSNCQILFNSNLKGYNRNKSTRNYENHNSRKNNH